MIVLDNVAITFNKGTPLEMPALRGINLTIPKGQFVTMIGSNGAGKSTLLNILSGELTPDRGKVLVDDVEVTRWPIHRRSSMIARLFQDPRAGICEQMSILENIAIAAGRTHPRGFQLAISNDLRKRAVERLATLGLGLEKRLDDRVALLSGGQRQALCLVMATFGQAKILLLDEHTAALDPKSADQVIQLTEEIVSREKLTALMVTHSMQQAVNLGDRIVMLHQGRVAHDFTGAEKRRLRPEDLVDRFHEIRARELLDERAAELLRATYA